MILTIVDNCHTKETEQYLANRLYITNKRVFFSSPENTLEVNIYNGILDRDDSSVVVATFKPIRILSGKFLDEASLEKEPQ